MSANFSQDVSMNAAGFAELQRGAKAMVKNSSRPHKQLVQRGELVSSTGNIAHLTALSPLASPLEEVERGIAFNSKRTQAIVPSWQDNEPRLQRSQLNITGKVFLKPESSTAAADIRDIAAKALVDLSTAHFDLLVLSAPTGADADSILDAWTTMESLHASGTATQIGLANVDAATLAAVHSRAQVKPSHIYLNHASPDATALIRFAREHNLRAMADSDTDVTLSNATRQFGQTYNRALVPPYASTSFKPLAALRYTSVIAARGVVASKGYSFKTKYVIS